MKPELQVTEALHLTDIGWRHMLLRNNETAAFASGIAAAFEWVLGLESERSAHMQHIIDVYRAMSPEEREAIRILTTPKPEAESDGKQV